MKLKSLVAFLFVVPVIAFGQVNKQVCFQATKTVANAPATLCLVSIEEDNAPGVMKVLSGDINMPEKLTITDFSRHNEERYKFKAEGLIASDWEISGCGYGYESFVKVEGRSDYGNISAKDLKVSVEVQSVRDTCHETGREYNLVEYKVVQ